METPLEFESLRLQQLRSEIASAERVLESLHTFIQRAGSETARLEEVLAENERLVAQSQHDLQEVDSAYAALDAAIKASETDPLTGLPNRIVLWDRLAHDITVAKRNGASLAVYFLDLDDFKRVNDQFGHAVGDRLLRMVATRLTATLRASDTVCRIGGDEFVLVVPEARQSDVDEVARKILKALCVPCTLDGHVLSPSASIGSSLYPVDGEDPESLVQVADKAMYAIKKLAKAGGPLS